MLTIGFCAGTDVALTTGPILLASRRASRHVVSVEEDRGRIAAVPVWRNYG
jgi:hypothetical protein